MSRTNCPESQPGCPYYSEEGSCFADTHHLAWPRPEYTHTALERVYRDLPENKVQLCRFEHDLQHEMPPPDKPSRGEMFSLVDAAYQLGTIMLSENRIRKIYGGENGPDI